jgi:hypothetical protein
MIRTVVVYLAFASIMHAAETDIHWTKNQEIYEMQLQFVKGFTKPLSEFDKSSGLIAASADGKLVLVVRSHYAYEVGDDRFMEMNVPPREGKGSSTQVINLFTLRDGGEALGSWRKITLPRDARVQTIRFVDGIWEIRILRLSDKVALSFRGPNSFVYNLTNVSAKIHGHTDKELWGKLGEFAEPPAGGNAE